MPLTHIDIINFDLKSIMQIENNTFESQALGIYHLLNNPVSHYTTVSFKESPDQEPYAQLIRGQNGIVLNVAPENKQAFMQALENTETKDILTLLIFRVTQETNINTALQQIFSNNTDKLIEHKGDLLERKSYRPDPLLWNNEQTIPKSFYEYDIEYDPVVVETQNKAVEEQCLEDFIKAQHALENVIQEVLENDEQVINLFRSVSNRIVQLIDIDTEIRLQEAGITSEHHVEIEQNAILSRVIAQTDASPHYPNPRDKSGVNVEMGAQHFQGFHGLSPLAIRNVLKDGNIRELGLIQLRSSDFLKTIINNAERLKKVNTLLFQKHGWVLDPLLIDQLMQGMAQGPEKKEKSASVRDSVKKSDRDSISSHLSQSPNPYNEAFHNTYQPQVGGVSGTAERTLTIASVLGYDTKHDLELLRMACLAWLIDTKCHSVDEIMVGCKAFELPYKAGPKSYEYICLGVGKEVFVEKLKENLQTKGLKLPDYYLSKEHVDNVLRSIEKNEFYNKKPTERNV